MRFHLTPVRTAEINGTTYKNAGGNIGEGKKSIHSPLMELQTSPPTIEISVENSQQSQNKFTSYTTPWQMPQRGNILLHRYLLMFMTDLLTILEMETQPIKIKM